MTARPGKHRRLGAGAKQTKLIRTGSFVGGSIGQPSSVMTIETMVCGEKWPTCHLIVEHFHASRCAAVVLLDTVTFRCESPDSRANWLHISVRSMGMVEELSSAKWQGMPKASKRMRAMAGPDGRAKRWTVGGGIGSDGLRRVLQRSFISNSFAI